MSLADLKRKAAAKKHKKLDVDDFIEDAAAYAKGQSVISQNKITGSDIKKPRHRNYKNATFTLSPSNIEQLNELAEHTGFAKSRILRLLIEKLADGSDIEINALLESLEKKNKP
ncbi:hypothetical protein [Pseudoalteromonas denitrificans]|uniref:Plasmid segregation centromere-binding protein ParG n=1 Tax=Pseudoalteromonas denitrificans DSM 6059 TaxID=1123010 RepID=A0A1I1FGB7_9GAMM|nr:hypothetical protein [Pseudoalteromonas denitrificans]SFB97996.1 hypothetical protein SAMN02745724_00611 [Pseudoalteromonas denitrificans DSM 6059]